MDNIPIAPTQICHLHIKFQETIQLPLSFMQMHVSSILWLSPKSFGHSSNREFLSRDTSIHMSSTPSCCTIYNTSSNAGFEEVTVLITIWINHSEYPIDSSIATYCSQPFEFVRNILCDKSILMSL